MENEIPSLRAFSLRNFLRDFFPGLNPRLVLSRVKSGVLPIELDSAGELVADPKVITALCVVVHMLARAPRAFEAFMLFQMITQGLREAAEKGPEWRALLVIHKTSGKAGVLLHCYEAAPRVSSGLRVVDLSSIEQRWRGAITRASKVADLSAERESLLVPEEVPA